MGKPNISQATRKKVLKIAKELNYYPNVIARGLATKRSNAIGVIVPNLASSFVVRVLQGIKSTNRDLNYTVLLFDTIGQKIWPVVSKLRSWMMSGMSCCGNAGMTASGGLTGSFSSAPP